MPSALPEASAAVPLSLVPIAASAPDPAVERRHRPRRAALLVLLYLAGTLLSCWGVRALLWADPLVPGEQAPRALLLVRHFLDQRDRLDAVFVGSSRFYRGVDPSAFDARATELGRPLRSFNDAMNGMRMPEILARADWILAQRPAELRWLFLELTTLDPVFRSDNREGRRMIAWHDARATADMLRVLAGSGRDWREVLASGRPHLAEFGYRLTNLGLGPVALARWSGAAPPDPWIEGFVGYLSEAEDAAQRRPPKEAGRATGDAKKTSERDEAEISEQDAAQGDTGPLRDDFRAAQRVVLAAFIERARAAGVEPVFVRAPLSTPDRTARLALEAGVIDTLLSYDERAQHPALYARELRRDGGHLNAAGAAAFSRQLAQDFLATDLAAGR